MARAKILIIGGGPAGCIAAHFLRHHDVTVVERSPFLGGTCRTEYYGGHPYTLGPRHFLTRSEKVWEYFNGMCPMKRHDGHEFLSFVEQDKAFYHFPIHADEVKAMPDADVIAGEHHLNRVMKHDLADAKNLEEYWVRSVGVTLYEKFIKGYSEKMWLGMPASEITDFGWSPKGVALKTGPTKAAWDEAFTGFPLARNGYDDYFTKATADATVHLNTHIKAFDLATKRVMLGADGQWSNWDAIVTTIAPDVPFRFILGSLRWVGRDFLKVVLPVKTAFPDNVFFLYYPGAEKQTRIVEYKKFYEWDRDTPTTLLGIEVPSGANKLYPYPTTADQAHAQRYLDLLPDSVYPIGRMASYRYLDMGMIIEQCFDLAEKVG